MTTRKSITGAPDIRVGNGTMFAPFRRLSFAELQQIREHAPVPDPEIGPDEAALEKLFLGRYESEEDLTSFVGNSY